MQNVGYQLHHLSPDTSYITLYLPHSAQTAGLGRLPWHSWPTQIPRTTSPWPSGPKRPRAATKTSPLSPHPFWICIRPPSASATPMIRHCTMAASASSNTSRAIGPLTFTSSVGQSHSVDDAPTNTYFLAGLPSPAEHHILTRLLSTLPHPSAVHSLLETSLQVPLPLHISLSAPLVLRTENKDSFLDVLTSQLAPIISSLRRPVSVQPASLSWHGNENSSRYFLVLRVQDTADDKGALNLLNQLLRASNRVAQEYGQPQLYTGQSRRDASERKQRRHQDDKQDFSSYFHISIGWALPRPDRKLQDENLEMQPAVETVMKDVCDMTVHFDAVKIRIGQNVTALPISPSRSRARG